MSSSSFLRSSLALFLVVGASACDGGGALTGDPVLPELSLFRIPKPHEMKAESSSQSSAACATDTTAYDRVAALIDEENGLAAADQALLEAALASTPDADIAIARYEAEIDGRTLRIEVVSEESSGSVFTGTLVVGEEETEVLSGTVVGDRTAGTIELTMPDSPELGVVWEDEEDGSRRVVRSQGDHQAIFELSDEDARLVVGETIAWWNKETYAGVIVDGADILCFDGGESADDFCDATCTPELIEKVTGE